MGAESNSATLAKTMSKARLTSSCQVDGLASFALISGIPPKSLTSIWDRLICSSEGATRARTRRAWHSRTRSRIVG